MALAPWLNAALDLMKRRMLQLGNRIKILNRDYRGDTAATLVIFDGGTVQFGALAPEIAFSIPVSEVRNNVVAGRKVIAATGLTKTLSGPL